MGLFSSSDEIVKIVDESGNVIQEGTKQAGSVWRSAARNATGTTGILTGGWLGVEGINNYADVKEANASAESAQSYEDAINQIQNDDSMTPEQKSDAIKEISQYFTNRGDGGDGFWQNMGVTQLLVVGVILLGLTKVVLESGVLQR